MTRRLYPITITIEDYPMAEEISIALEEQCSGKYIASTCPTLRHQYPIRHDIIFTDATAASLIAIIYG